MAYDASSRRDEEESTSDVVSESGGHIPEESDVDEDGFGAGIEREEDEKAWE